MKDAATMAHVSIAEIVRAKMEEIAKTGTGPRIYLGVVARQDDHFFIFDIYEPEQHVSPEGFIAIAVKAKTEQEVAEKMHLMLHFFPNRSDPVAEEDARDSEMSQRIGWMLRFIFNAQGRAVLTLFENGSKKDLTSTISVEQSTAVN